jgi:integration host factor subunit beta
MTKSDLIEQVGRAWSVPTTRAEEVVNAIFDTLETALQRGERIEIRGFGSFEVRQYGAYAGRNPRTGSTVEVKPKRLPFFKVGKELRERITEATRGAKPAAKLATNLATPAKAQVPSGVSAPDVQAHHGAAAGRETASNLTATSGSEAAVTAP